MRWGFFLTKEWMCLLECYLHGRQGPFGWQSVLKLALLTMEFSSWLFPFSRLVIVLLLDTCFVLVFQGITFDEFRSFFQFLNNLEDFAIAMQMYNFASRSIGQGEWRAVTAGVTGIESLCTQIMCCSFKLYCAKSCQNDQKCFYCLTYQMSLQERCMWPLGWSWHVTLYTPSSRSLMLIMTTSSPIRSSLE